ncbi:DUF4349 domain-containing protein [bacterium]|nr:DUF4349 domain-containing protein [bacterium]
MFVRCLKVGLVAALLSFSAQAEPHLRMTQSHYSAQVQVQDMGTISRSVDQLCRECQAHITNFNCDINNANGNLNVRVPEEKLGRFCEGLRKVGLVRSENRSSSDNTSSYVEAQRNLEIAEKSLSSQWTVSGSALNAKEKGLVDAEFKAYLRDRINSYRSTINNYEQNHGFAEVSVNLSGTPIRPEQAPEQARQPAHPRQRLETTQFEVVAEPTAVAPVNNSTNLALLGPAAVMLALIAFFVVKQRSRPEPESSRPDPVTQSDV